MIVMFSILLYPIFFILAYICGEYIYPTKNGAMLFALCSAFVISYLYYTIRVRVSQQTQNKFNQKLSKDKALTSLLLINEKKFKSLFNEKNTIADNSYTGINEEKILEYLRENKGPVHIYSIKGITEGGKNFLEFLKIEFFIHSTDEILEKAKDLVTEDIEIVTNHKKLKIFTKALTSPAFKKFALKYGVILLVLSLITPYKIYYIVFGCALITFSLMLNLKKFINQRNQIPYLRS